MKKLISITTLLLLLATTCISQYSCTKETEEPTSESNRWLELLNVLPANENTLKAAYLQDFVYLSEKMQQYPEVSDEYPITHNLPLFGDSPNAYTDEEWKQTLGFVFGDVDQTIYAGAMPAYYYEAVRGRFSRNDVDNAVRTGPMNEMLEVVTYYRKEFYSWGTDNDINLSMRSNVRRLGRGFRLALVDNFIFWIRWTDGMKDMIDSYENNIDSLADIENYRLLADALEDFDVCRAFFSSESQSQSHVKEIYQDIWEEPSTEIGELFIEEVERQVLLKPYQALATGAGIDEKGYYLVIVLANPNEAVAQQNASLLKQRVNQGNIVFGGQSGQKWSDIIGSMEIESKGRLTLAKLYGKVCVYWDDLAVIGLLGLYQPLLMHE